MHNPKLAELVVATRYILPTGVREIFVHDLRGEPGAIEKMAELCGRAPEDLLASHERSCRETTFRPRSMRRSSVTAAIPETVREEPESSEARSQRIVALEKAGLLIPRVK
jgi:hypothetical protein